MEILKQSTSNLYLGTVLELMHLMSIHITCSSCFMLYLLDNLEYFWKQTQQVYAGNRQYNLYLYVCTV